MKEIGIVRRIDELGRIVIPKEIRRVLKIKEGEQLEILTNDDTLTLKKFNQIHGSSQDIDKMCSALGKSTGKEVMVCDRHSFIANYGKNSLLGEEISGELFSALENRKPFLSQKTTLNISCENLADMQNFYVSPLLCCGDLYGGLLLGGKQIEMADMAMCDIASEFLSQSIEQ